MNEDVKSENVRIHSRADELIACLEGEIAKRDARIVELERYEHAFNEWHDKTEWVQAESATLSAKYLGCHRADVMRSLIDDLRAELAACRVAVENCEVFRARIAELEARIVWLECEAQVNAAPVSEAKAQGVVNLDESQEAAEFESQFQGCKAFMRDSNASEAAGKYVCQRSHMFKVWMHFRAMLAAPAAPAADAGLVEALETIINPIEAMRRELQVGEQLNGMVAMQLASDPEYLRGVAKAAIAAHRAKGVV